MLSLLCYSKKNSENKLEGSNSAENNNKQTTFVVKNVDLSERDFHVSSKTIDLIQLNIHAKSSVDQKGVALNVITVVWLLFS